MLKSKKPKENKETKLENINRELFCQLYSGKGAMEYFGNGLKSYAKAYGYEEKMNKAEEELVIIKYSKEDERKKKRQEILSMQNTCKSNANKLLTNTYVIKRCDELLYSLYDERHMDKELAWAATQRKDVASKVAGIREFNRVKNRVDEKIINQNTFYQWNTDEDLSKGAKIEEKPKKK